MVNIFFGIAIAGALYVIGLALMPDIGLEQFVYLGTICGLAGAGLASLVKD